MKVYLDLVFLLNFFFDFILLLATSIMLKRNIKWWRISIGSLIGAISLISLFMPLNSLTLFLVKVIISILMVLITFGFKDIRYTLKNLAYLYFISVLLGGMLYFLNLQFSYKNEGLIFFFDGLSINWIFLVIISPVIIYIYIRQAQEIKTNYAHYYPVDIYLKEGTILKTNAFLDSGNKLIDPYKKRPIILVHSKKIEKLFLDKSILVPYDTVSGHGMLKCLKPEKIIINGVGERKNLLVGYLDSPINIDGVNCLLHEKVMEGR